MSKSKSKKLTVRFSKRLKSEMQDCVISQNYGFHGKSKWITEAIDNFLHQDNYVDYVENAINTNQSELDQIEAFYLNQSTFENLKKALLKVRLKYPLLEGVQSALIRACVIYRLMLKK